MDIRKLQIELGKMLLPQPQKPKGKSRYIYEVSYHAEDDYEIKSLKASSKKAIKAKERDLISKGFVIVIVECWKENPNGTQDLVWSY